MRIALLTPGTGNFHCGSCLRDQALARALRRAGHDAVLVPMYLPLVLDDTEVEPGLISDKLFFGGVSVWLDQKVPGFRKLPRKMHRAIDRWLASPRVLAKAAAKAGMTDPHDLGEMTLSMLQGEHGRQRQELDTLASWLRRDRPDVVMLSNAMLLGIARRAHDAAKVPIVCSLQGEEAFLDGLAEPWRSRAWSALTERVRDADALIAVSRYYGHRMRDRLRLDGDAVTVVANGIDLDGLSPPDTDAPTPDPPTLGYLARLCEDKGLPRLVDAYLRLAADGRHPTLRLHLAGAATAADKPLIEAMLRKLYDAGLERRVTVETNITRPRKAELLRSLSVLSVPAEYGESFGLYLLEAWACGVPVVQPETAAFPELVEATGGGVLVPPGDTDALASGIASVLDDEPGRQAMGRAGCKAVRTRYTSDHMAAGVLRVLETVRGPGRSSTSAR